jgi:SAM-dependent methyltransferase
VLTRPQRDFHHLDPTEAFLEQVCEHPELLGLSEEDLRGKDPAQIRELLIGEYFAQVAAEAGEIASRYLMHAQWSYRQGDWFDHRHHFLDPKRHCNDDWIMSANNVIGTLPLGGRLLDLCAGDAFYDFYFYRHRAEEIVCVDVNPEAYRQYLRLHQAENISYRLEDVLAFEAPPESFDVVAIRGAIEHFTAENQQLIFQKALRALKVGGWFCGDTPANPEAGKVKDLEAHEFEWKDEAQMLGELALVFEHIETQSVVSRKRETLFWRCQKIR